MKNNIHYVNNSGSDIRLIFPFFVESYKNKKLHEELIGLFVIEFVYGLNQDGSPRMIINAA